MRLLLAAAAVALLPSLASAATCRTITYFSTAAQTVVVGVWSNCPGRKGLKGRRSAHKEIITEEISGSPGGPGGPKPPCEFTPAGCSPIPSPR